jgi:hypothetical protein
VSSSLYITCDQTHTEMRAETLKRCGYAIGILTVGKVH